MVLKVGGGMIRTMKIRNILAVGMIALLLTSIAAQAISISSVKKEKTTNCFLSKIPAEYRVLLEQNKELKEQLENMIKNGLSVYATVSSGMGLCIFFPPLLPVLKAPWSAQGCFVLGYYLKYKDGGTTSFNLATGEGIQAKGPHTVTFVGPAFGMIVAPVRGVSVRLFLFSLNQPTIIQS